MNLLQKYKVSLMQRGLHRQRRVIDNVRLNFSSNDYLSFSDDPICQKAFQRGFALYPCGSTSSMVIAGYHPIHRDLEKAFAEALNVEDALLFSSGYAANLAVIALLHHLQHKILIDKSVHASIYDGLKMSQAGYKRFLHNDLAHLQVQLKQMQDNTVVMTEGVFGMSGAKAPLAELLKLCDTEKASCIVDEAHSFGVLGSQGRGAIFAVDLDTKDIPLRMIPLGKGMGAQGAIIAGKGDWIDALLQSARSYIYSTGLSPAYAYGILENLQFLLKADERRQKLFALVEEFRGLRQQSPFNWSQSDTPIQQLQLACPHKALLLSELLQKQGIFCQAIREPTVPKKLTCLRLSLNYHHQPEDIRYFFEQLEKIVTPHAFPSGANAFQSEAHVIPSGARDLLQDDVES